MPLAKNNNLTRPRKTGAAKRRRQLELRRRLVAMGLPEDRITRLDDKKVRFLVHNPRRLKDYIR